VIQTQYKRKFQVVQL